MAEDKIPELVEFVAAKRCPICDMPFFPSDKPSMQEALENHVEKQHQRGQTSGDVNQAAARIVREDTKE
jgi:hypothetical protein